MMADDSYDGSYVLTLLHMMMSQYSVRTVIVLSSYV